ncbi:MAG: Uma2 family endonuclease [Planctomycetes bacterium]|nr:Uma2 family endonuclease [Planctomycetota bacterium]
MATVAQKRATLDDLYCTPEKAELIGGRIVIYMATGRKPNRVGGRIYRSLDDHAAQVHAGEAFTDNLGYVVSILPSGRESFSPDASYHRGPFPKDPMRFVTGSPHFAAEVRSENDYTPAAEMEMADKRTDYFQAGTEVVWDIDTIAECIHVYRASDPDHPVTYRRGDTAEAEPAVPGWRVTVDWIFS